MRNYGLPYKGSKSRIVQELLPNLPSAKHFYDLFMGGGAVIHAALLAGRWETYTGNDERRIIVDLFRDGVNGKFANESRWISREQFNAEKGKDGYIAACWSFGNNCWSYIYGANIEKYKRAIHYMLFFGDYAPINGFGIYPPKFDGEKPHDKYLQWKAWFRTAYPEMENGSKQQKRATYLQSLQSLQRLQSLERLQRLELFSTDYQNIEIKPNSVIYCDIPYKGTDQYGDNTTHKTNNKFDYERFYDWCERQTEPVYISEYDMPRDRFTPIWEKKTAALIAAAGQKESTERLFRPNTQLKSEQITLF